MQGAEWLLQLLPPAECGVPGRSAPPCGRFAPIRAALPDQLHALLSEAARAGATDGTGGGPLARLRAAAAAALPADGGLVGLAAAPAPAAPPAAAVEGIVAALLEARRGATSGGGARRAHAKGAAAAAAAAEAGAAGVAISLVRIAARGGAAARAQAVP
ncbi:MAG: hypothetical protein J3K34DRAFT_516455 [Monoraphidium minutum]|nr:MAG: hypothetical protein J3K34DRAFT_516455 [Monoraphidium minutum]